jgi:multidrug efflux system membrane fusion protein
MTRPLFRRRGTWLIGAGLLALLLLLGWSLRQRQTSAGQRPAQAAAPVVRATTVRVQQRDMPLYLSGIGTVSAMQSVTVRVRIDGQLDKVSFVEGPDVVSGQLLAQLDPRTLQAQLAQAQAQKARDLAQLTNARRDLQRTVTLIRQDAATQQALDAQRAQVAQLEAALQSDDAQIHYAKVQLSFTRITAPISGRLGARLVDPGNIVHAADANGLVVINQIDPIAVVFTLPEESFQDNNRALHEGRPLPVLAFPRNSEQMLGQGHLTLLNNQIDTASGTVQMKGSFPNPAHTLWPGQYVNVRLVLGQHRQALTVPAAVVQRGPNGTYAYVVAADNTVSTQPIEVVNIQEGTAIIGQGLAAGQRVVLDGQYKLKPGLRIVESPSPLPPAAGAGAGPGAAGRPGSNTGAVRKPQGAVD